MKKEIRLIGIDDSPFNKFKKGNVLVIATIFRGGNFLEGVLSTSVRIDGNNSTLKLIKMINNCKFKPQLQAILIDGIALGGFNVIDVEKLNQKTNLPIINVIRKYPNLKKIKKTLEKIKQKNKFKLIKKAGTIHKVGNIYIQITGISLIKAKQILKISCTRSHLPEPIRTSHIIASGIVSGESKGNA